MLICGGIFHRWFCCSKSCAKSKASSTLRSRTSWKRRFLSVYIYIYTHMYIYIYIHLYIYIHIYVYIYIYVYICIYIYICICIHTHVYIYIWILMNTCIFVHICIYLYANVCLFTDWLMDIFFRLIHGWIYTYFVFEEKITSAITNVSFGDLNIANSASYLRIIYISRTQRVTLVIPTPVNEPCYSKNLLT